MSDNYNTAGSNSFKIILVVFSFFIYSVLFFLLFQITDQRVSVLSLLPVITASLLFGMRSGIFISVFLIMINSLYLYLLGLPSISIMIQNIPGAAGIVAIGATLGYLHDLQRKSKQQLKVIEKEILERKKAEEKLFEILNEFQPDLQNRENRPGKPNNSASNSINNIPLKIYREISENAADIIYTVNLEGYFTYVNKMGLNSTCFSLDEFLKLKCTDLITPGFRDKVKRFYLKQYLQRELTTYIEFPLKIKDGSVKWYGQNATLIIEDEKITGFSFIARDITVRKNIEDELKKNEEIHRSITYTANDAIISIDNKFIIIQWNRSAERMYGYSESEILGKSIKEIIPPDEREIFDNIIHKENPKEGMDCIKTVERSGFRKDGSIFPVEISIADWKRDNKRFYTYIIRDVTERKEAELKIQQSEKDYRQLFATAHEPILLIRPDDEVILEANERACKVYDYKHSDFIGMSLKQLSKDIERGEEKIFETLNHENFINFETIQYRSDGKELHLEVYASITEYKGEKAILSFNREITERVLAEKKVEEYQNKLEKLVEERTEKLKETNQRLFTEIQKLTEADLKIQNQVEFFKTLIYTIPIPVFIRDRNNFYSDCNKAFEDFFGIAKKNIIGKEKINLTPVEGEKNSCSKNTYETNVIDKEGKIHRVIIYQEVLLRRDNRSEGMVGVILDITRQKKMQEEIKKAFEAEKELSALRSRFVSTASHEFRTPLTTILASTELLLRYFQEWDESKKITILNRILNSAGYMNGLITDVLTMNKSESGRISFNPQNMEIVSLCNSIIEEIKLTAKPEHKFEFYYSHPQITGNFDGGLIRQFISNLLSNAVKYSPDGGLIQLSVDKNEKEIIFEVKDNGIGISEEDQQNLFQPFFRGTNISNIPGTGLGLSILKKAVELHNGKFEFHSKLNSGSTFKIGIPLAI